MNKDPELQASAKKKFSSFELRSITFRSMMSSNNIWLVVVKPLVWLYHNLIKHDRIPGIGSDILLLSGTKLAEKIRNKELKCEDIIRTYMKRIEEVNPVVNAVVEPRFVQALFEADSVDQFILTATPEEIKRLEQDKPLYGVPITVKESIPIKDLSDSRCSLVFKGMKGTFDNEIIEHLKNAGAIIIANTATPEFCMSYETKNFITGRTCNPYDGHCTSGGSSGGEGALLGSAASVIGVGSDFAGSIRIPALFCGVFGHKPTGELIDLINHHPIGPDPLLLALASMGPLCRYAEDLKLVLKVISGPKADILRLDQKINISSLKIYYVKEFEAALIDLPSKILVDADIKRLFGKATKYLNENYGCEIIHEPIANLEHALELAFAKFGAIESLPYIFQERGKPGEKFLEFEIVKGLFGLSRHTIFSLSTWLAFKRRFYFTSGTRKNANEALEDTREEMIDKLGENGVLLMPTFPSEAFTHHLSFLKICGLEYPAFVNALRFPACHVPMGLSSNGLPIGFQVVAAPYQDRLCLAVAEALERGFGGWVHP